MVFNVPTTRDKAPSLIELDVKVMSVGGLFLAAAFTTLASVKLILPEPAVFTSAAVAVLT